MTKTITTSTGYQIKIDKEDWPKVKHIKWYVKHNKHADYAVGTKWCSESHKQITYSMHRLIMDAPKGMDVDHINHNGLDNRKANLRLCTRSQNLCNKSLSSRNTTGYKGITWIEKYQVWAVKIKKDNKQYHVGQYKDKIEAAIAYNQKAQELFGEFACLNIIP